jgi:hypothetical protein
MKLSRRQLFLIAGAVAQSRASENEFWNTKAPAEWSPGDIYQLMNHSPWANPVTATRRRTVDGSDSDSPGGSHRDANARTGVSNGTERPRNRTGPKAVVTWESAQPLRDALKTSLPDVLAGCYVIGVDGMPLSDAIPDALQGDSVLRYSGKHKWAASAVVVRELVRTSSVYAFGISRADAPIGPNTGDVTFEAKFGRWTIAAKFKPVKMLYRGNLAL